MKKSFCTGIERDLQRKGLYFEQEKNVESLVRQCVVIRSDTVTGWKD